MADRSICLHGVVHGNNMHGESKTNLNSRCAYYPQFEIYIYIYTFFFANSIKRNRNRNCLELDL